MFLVVFLCGYVKILQPVAICTVIFVTVTTRLDYCNALYMGVSGSSIARLQLVQNAAACVLTGARKFEHISQILASLHWLPVHFRIYFKMILFAFKSLNGLAPLYLSELLHPYTPSLRSGQLTSCSWGFLKLGWSSEGTEHFRFKLWNNLPLHIRQATSLCNFKTLLKTHLFSLAFSTT